MRKTNVLWQRLSAFILAAVMLVSLIPVGTFAEEVEAACTTPDLCADGIHTESCPEYAAPNLQCTKDPACTYRNGHEDNCSTFVPCEAEDCTKAKDHEGSHSSFVKCTVTEACTLTDGHTDACNAPAEAKEEHEIEGVGNSCATPDLCAQGHTESCPAYMALHLQCELDAACTYENGHNSNCSTFVPCETDGCADAKDHEGQHSNFVKCTLTEGCILEDGHTGTCATQEETKEENTACDKSLECAAAEHSEDCGEALADTAAKIQAELNAMLEEMKVYLSMTAMTQEEFDTYRTSLEAASRYIQDNGITGDMLTEEQQLLFSQLGSLQVEITDNSSTNLSNYLTENGDYVLVGSTEMSGTLNLEGNVLYVHGVITVPYGETLTVTGGGSLEVSGGSLTVAGTMNLQENTAVFLAGGGSASVSGTLNNYGSLHIGFDGNGSMTVTGTLNSYGYLNIPGGTLTSSGNLNIPGDSSNGIGYSDVAGTIHVTGGTFAVGGETFQGGGKAGGINLRGTLTVADGVDKNITASAIAVHYSEDASVIGVDANLLYGLFVPSNPEEVILASTTAAGNHKAEIHINADCGLIGNAAISSNTVLTVAEGITFAVDGGTLIVKGQVTIVGSIFVVNGGSVELENTLTNNGSLHVYDGCTFSIPGGSLTNNGYFCIHEGGNVSVSSGTLNNTTAANAYIDISSNADLHVSNGSVLSNGNLLTVGGEMTVHSSTFSSSSGFGVTQTGILNLVNTSLAVPAYAEVKGILNVAEGAALTINSTLDNIGAINVNQQGTLTVNGTLNNANWLHLGLDNTLGYLTVPTGGTLNNSGYLNVSSGSVAIGGTLAILDDAEAQATGFVELHANMTVTGTLTNNTDPGIAIHSPAVLDISLASYSGSGNVYVEYESWPDGLAVGNESYWLVENQDANGFHMQYNAAAGNLTDIVTDSDDKTVTEMVDAVQGLETEELKNAMEADSAVVETIKNLEKEFVDSAETTISTSVTVTEESDDVFEKSEITIVGAALNADLELVKDNNTAGVDTEITLVVDKSEETYETLGKEYENDTIVSFSMTMTGVENPSELAVPVQISLPVPDTIDPYKLVILHYHGVGEPEVIHPAIVKDGDKAYAQFVVAGFSDFVMAQTHTHSYGPWQSDDKQHWKVCTAASCGESTSKELHIPDSNATANMAQTCTLCGYVITPAINHSHGNMAKEVMTACTTVEYYKCDCGQLFSDSGATKPTTLSQIQAQAAHSLARVPAKAADCTNPGTRSHYKCSGCSKLFSDANGTTEIRDASSVVIPTKEHKTVQVPPVSATCTSTGTAAHYKCSSCGKLFTDAGASTGTTLEALTVPKTAHTSSLIAAVSATCTKVGNIAHYKCSSCGGLFQDSAGSIALASVTTPATGHKDNNVNGYCDICGARVTVVTTVNGVPKTDDNSNTILWGTLLGISLLGSVLCVLVLCKKRIR